jgi:hypothetical protein
MEDLEVLVKQIPVNMVAGWNNIGGLFVWVGRVGKEGYMLAFLNEDQKNLYLQEVTQ